jgi:hypothetical protein
VILAAAAAFGLAALTRPHYAILALALAAPLARSVQAQPRDIEILAAATVAGALIAAARRRLTPLRAGRPSLLLPAILFEAAMIRIGGPVSAVPLGIALAYVASRHARDGVTRPIHLIRAAVAGGIIAVAFPPRFESVAVLEATISLVAIVLGLVSLAWMVPAFVMRLARGFKAYLRDRVLIGAIAAITGFVALIVQDPIFRPELMIPFGILVGATLARADGDAFESTK